MVLSKNFVYYGYFCPFISLIHFIVWRRVHLLSYLLILELAARFFIDWRIGCVGFDLVGRVIGELLGYAKSVPVFAIVTFCD